MRVSSLLLLSSLSVLSEATGYTGSLERIFKYAAYEMEDLAGLNPAIATGCGAAQNPPVTRCSFGQFLNYIWRPKPGETDADRPVRDYTLLRAASTQNGQQIPEKRATIVEPNIKTVINAIGRTFPNGNDGRNVRVNDWVDPSRLYNGLGPPDYLEAIVKTGEVISQVRDWLLKDENKSNPNVPRIKQLLQRASDAVVASHEVRSWERDNHASRRPQTLPADADPQSGLNRRQWLEEKSAKQMVMMAAPNTMRLITSSNPQVIDVYASAIHVGEQFSTYHKQYVQNPWQNSVTSDHIAMIDITQEVAAKIQCSNY